MVKLVTGHKKNTFREYKIARVATVPFALLGSRNVLNYLSKKFDLQVICSNGDYLEEIQSVVSKPILNIEIKRSISPIKDILSVWNLYKILRKERFHIVHSNTPKGGLISAIASWLARTPVRCHTFTGQRWTTLKGFKRFLLKSTDRIVCRLNTNLYADSTSQIKFLEENKIPGTRKIMCLGKGGFAGIDLKRFNKTSLLELPKPSWLTDKPNVFRVGFVGRIVKEKGIEILLRAFERLKSKGFDIELILIGPFEPQLDPIDKKWENYINNNDSVIHTGYLSNPEQALVYCNVFCLPSLREGFPMVVLEAACLGIPSVISRIPGSIDTIIEEKTGFSFDLKDSDELVRHLERLYNDKELTKNLGVEAEKYVRDHFADTILQKEFEKEYLRLFSLC